MKMKMKLLTMCATGVLLALGASVDSVNYPDMDKATHRQWQGFDEKDEQYPHHPIQGPGEIQKKPEPAKVMAPERSASYIVDDDDLIWFKQTAPENAGVGEEYPVDVELKALEDIADVEVHTAIPDGATYIRSEPNAMVQGDELVWKIDSMKEGDVKHLKAWFKYKGEGEYKYCTTAHAFPMACTITKVGMPLLEISKDGPESVKLGESITYHMVVKNIGSAVASDVKIKDMIPKGLLYKDGESEAMFDIGSLEPGASKSVSITVDAKERGRFCNTATASGSNVGAVSDDACTRVFERKLDIVKSGAERQFVGKAVTYNITVTNSGDTDLMNVSVKDMVDSSTKLVKADGGSFMIDKLAAGQSQSFAVDVMGMKAGKFCDRATADAEGLSVNAEACTEWLGHSAILVEMVDTTDPLLVGAETTYKIRVTNQGDAADGNIRITAKAPAQLQILDVSGATAGKISGNSVSFDAYKVLQAKETIEFTIRVKATSIGDGRMHVEVNSDMLNEPVTEEESTQVY